MSLDPSFLSLAPTRSTAASCCSSTPSFTQRSTYSDVFDNPPDEVQINFGQVFTLADVPATDVPCTDEDFPEYQPKPIQGPSTPKRIRKIYVNGQEFDLPPDSTLTPPQITQAVIDALGLTKSSNVTIKQENDKFWIWVEFGVTVLAESVFLWLLYDHLWRLMGYQPEHIRRNFWRRLGINPREEGQP
jgi:hypothetical protein